MWFRWGKGAAPGLATVALLLALGACSSSPEKEDIRHAPDFTLATIDGNRVRLSDFKGKVVLLDFWATWCPPCRAAIPHLVELQEKYGKDGLVVIGMNMDQNPDDLAEFMSRTTFNYPVVRVDEQTRTAYGGVPSIPMAFLIDRKGRIREKYMGYSAEIAENMDRMIQHLLQETPLADP